MVTEQPGIHLVVGPPNAGKMGTVLDWWQASRSRRPLLVVPNRPAAAALALELAGRVGAVVGSRPVVTFDDLVAELLGHRPALAGSLERQLVVATLVGRASLQGLEAIAGYPGTVRAVTRLFEELSEGGLTAEQGEAVLSRWLATSPADDAALAGDLSRLARDYARTFGSRGRGGRGDVAAAATEAIERWDRPVACYGFASFTPAQRLVLRGLAARVAVVLALVWEREGGVGGEEAREWAPAAVRVEELGVQPQAFSSPSLASLERGVARGDRTILRPDPAGDAAPLSGVRFLLAAGHRHEAELVAAEIVDLLRAGLSPDDIGVLVRGQDPWQRLLQRVFRGANIPHRFDGEVTFGRTALGHALLGGLRGVALHDVDGFLSFFRSPFSGASPDEVDRLEARILGRPDLSGPALSKAVEQSFPESIARLRGVLTGRADGTDGGPEASGLDGAAIRTLARDVLRTAAAGSALTSPELEEDARALAALDRALRECESCAAGAEGGLPLVPVLLDMLAEVLVPLGGGDARGVVQVLSVHRARARRWQVVFLLGLVDGEFPAPPVRPGLLSSKQRRVLNRSAGRSVLDEPAAGGERELFAFALSRPWQLLYLSARNAEDDGGDAIVSPFWTEAYERAGRPALWRTRDLGYVAYDLAATEDVEPFFAGGPVSERAYLQACALADLAPAGPFRERLVGLPTWAPPRGGFTRPAVLEELEGRAVFSASELEAYAQCPFGWFTEKVLRPAGMETVFDARAQGSLAHQVLADVYRGLKTAGALPLTSARLPEAYGLVDHHLRQRLEKSAHVGAAADRHLAALVIRTQLTAFLAAEAAAGTALVPVAFEEGVGRPGGVDLGGLLITGRIDRLDGGPGRSLFVIDYKTGQTVYGPALAANGALQVALYLLALRTAFPEAHLLGGGYAALGSDRRRGIVRRGDGALLGSWFTCKAAVDDEEFEAELSACLDVAKEAAAGIRQGSIPAQSRTTCPPYCELGSLCRARRGR